MSAGQSYSNFNDLWQDVAESDGDKMLFRVPTQQAGQVLAFRARAFLKRAARIANVFRNTLKLKPGSRVALLSQTPEDFGLVLHGAWLARVVPVVVPRDLSDEALVTVLKQTSATAVVFPPESSARIASLFGKASQVEHWIASGKAGGGSSGSVTHKLEELALRADMDIPQYAASDAECDGLIVPTSGNVGSPSYVLFSQRAVIESAKAAASIYPPDAPEGSLYWCGLPFEEFNALLHNCVSPLFAKVVAYVSTEVDMRSFWETAYADDFSFCVLLQSQLRTIYMRGKPRAWLKPDNFKLVAYTKEPFSMSLLTGFEERFLTPVFPCYSLVEAGGVISCFPYGEDEAYRKEWLADFDVPSSGVPLPDVTVSVTTGGGQTLGEEYMGTLRIQSTRGISEYIVAGHDQTKMQMAGAFISGDEGYFVKDKKGREHLFMHGRTSDMIERGDMRISPARANGVLAEIRGIEWARTLGFPNATMGYEVGAFVVPKRAANITEAAVMAQLRVNLDWDECPKVVIFGERDSSGNYPSKSQIESAFTDFFDIDYDFDRS